MSVRKAGVLFARLTGDNDRDSVRRTLCQVLQQELGDIIEILTWPNAIEIDFGYESQAALSALATGREWLSNEKCDLLVWGQINPNRVLSLQFTTIENVTVSEQYFPPSVTCNVALDVLSELGPAIAARALEGIASIEGAPNDDVLDALRRLAAALSETAKRSSTSFNSASRGLLLCTLGDVLQKLGENSAGNEELSEAIDIYREALEDWKVDRFPLRWATLQTKLGNALCALGEREASQSFLQEAVSAHQQALEIRWRDKVPLLWAASQINLGHALCSLGENENAADRFEQAVIAFREALAELTRDRVPLQWTIVQMRIAAALCALAKRDIGVANLQEAIDVLRGLHEYCNKDGPPLLWATFQHIFGDAQRALGERTTGTERLKRAVATLKEALVYTPRAQFPILWGNIQNDLGNALVRLGEREQGVQPLNEAIGAYREALGERRRERFPLLWAATQSSLGNALAVLGERLNSVHELQQSVIAYGAALDVFTSIGPSHYSDAVRRSLTRAEIHLEKQRRKELVGSTRRQDASLRLS